MSDHTFRSLSSRTLRLAASFPPGDALRGELAWQVMAAQLFDVDKLGGSLRWRADKALQHIGVIVTHGKQPVWVVDHGGALKAIRNLPKEIAAHAEGSLLEAAAYASEGQDWEEEGTLHDLADKVRRTRFKVEAIVSPRTKKRGYKITW